MPITCFATRLGKAEQIYFQMKARNQQKVELDPAEWDFSSLKPGLASQVLRYELARSSPRACEDIDEILSQTFHGESLRRTLLNLTGRLDENAIRLVFGGAQAGAYSFRILRFAAEHPFFPTPWNKLPKAERQIFEEAARIRSQNQNHLVFDALSEESARTYLEKSRTNQGYSFGIVSLDLDSTSSKAKLVGTFKRWLDKQPVMKSKPGRGSSAAEPFADLRALAAHRFKSSGISWNDALKEMEERAFKKRIDIEKRQVFGPIRRKWPYYDDAGNWTRALQRATKLIRDWEKHFQPSNGWDK